MNKQNTTLTTLASITQKFMNETAGVMGGPNGQSKKIATALVNSVKPIAMKLKKLTKAQKHTQVKATATSVATPSIPAHKPGPAKIAATTVKVDNLKPLLAANNGAPLVYNAETRSQFRAMRLLLATVAAFGYECAVGVKAKKLQVIVAPKGAPIPKKFFVKGFQYPSAIKAGAVIGIDGNLQATTAGKSLLHAVKNIQGTKALVSIEPTASAIPMANTNPLNPAKFTKPVQQATAVA